MEVRVVLRDGDVQPLGGWFILRGSNYRERRLPVLIPCKHSSDLTEGCQLRVHERGILDELELEEGKTR